MEKPSFVYFSKNKMPKQQRKKFCSCAEDMNGIILVTHFQYTNVVAVRQSTAQSKDCHSSHNITEVSTR